MKTCTTLAVLLLAAHTLSAAHARAFTYEPTPAGWVLSHCIHTVPSDSHIHEQPDGSTHVLHPSLDGGRRVIPECDTQDGAYAVLVPRAHAEDAQQAALVGYKNTTTAAAAPSRRRLQLPPDYNGWLQYTAYEDAAGFDAFLGYFSVPDVPKKVPQVLYLFTGLQNIDWIPKHDPMPSAAFDIIQPVLQFPCGFLNLGWCVKSWYVTTKAGALQSTALSVKAGDNIYGNMTRTGGDAWFVGSLSNATGQSTNLNAHNAARLKSQPWAYNTLECYGCNGCGTYPKQPSRFTELALVESETKKAVEAAWEVNPKPASDEQCKEGTIVEDPATVTIYFNGKPQEQQQQEN